MLKRASIPRLLLEVSINITTEPVTKLGQRRLTDWISPLFILEFNSNCAGTGIHVTFGSSSNGSGGGSDNSDSSSGGSGAAAGNSGNGNAGGGSSGADPQPQGGGGSTGSRKNGERRTVTSGLYTMWNVAGLFAALIVINVDRIL